ncbi:MAG: hypothetical protein BBJ57_07185 [Desulfobacterales bacterium PC51MH44]|nr:MAG: hypothetical protein BBJ57_07185 [Desulfobacterales bacterium PC51MH44]
MITQITQIHDETAYNRAYLATVLRTSAQIPLRGISDTLKTLTAIALRTRIQTNVDNKESESQVESL